VKQTGRDREINFKRQTERRTKKGDRGGNEKRVKEKARERKRKGNCLKENAYCWGQVM
jgi:hypothetical protein